MEPERARELLARERERVEQAVARLGRERSPGFADEDDRGETGSEILYQDEFDAGLADDLAQQLAAVERAEARLVDGSYGLSIDSGLAIPDERLEAVPAAERTVEEQALHERG